VLDATSSVTSITPSSTITVTASLAAAANATEVAGSEAAANITAAGQTSKSNKDETVITLPSQEKSYGDAEFGYSGKRTIVPDEVQYKSPDRLSCIEAAL
jgi:4-hydroxy-L-threonine phosphate dehydrogenase PdxA